MATALRPSAEQDHAVLQKLIEDDPTGSFDLFRLYLEPLTARLAQRLGTGHEDEAEESAHNALLALVRDPGRYDPSCGKSLLGYLVMDAWGDVLNRRKQDGHRREAEKSHFSVRASDRRRNSTQEDPARLAEESERRREGTLLLDQLGRELPERDVPVFRLLRAGEECEEEYARVLGVLDLPEAQRQAAVRKAKDRVRKRLSRRAERYEPRPA